MNNASRMSPVPSSRHHHHHHRHHHHHHHHSSSARKRHEERHEEEQPGMGPPSPHEQSWKGRIPIDLSDLDEDFTLRPRTKIGAKKTSNLGHIASFLKQRFDAPEGRSGIASDDGIEFYHLGERLDEGGEIPRGASALRYRVVRPQSDGYPEIVWVGPSAIGRADAAPLVRLCQSDLDEIAVDIRSGASVGQVRRRVASALDASWPGGDARGRAPAIDPDRVEICTFGGLREGPVEGDEWTCRNLRSWRCRYLVVGLAPAGHYFVFRGLNERYVYHNPAVGFREARDGACLRRWLAGVLASVGEAGGRLDDIREDDVTLFFACGGGSGSGRPVGDAARVRRGLALDFRLRRETGLRFARAEAWLLPAAQTCSICVEDKRVSEMPEGGRITRGCAHEATACRECLGQWIASSMETVAWDRLKCPECPERLAFEDVAAFAARDVFDRYDKLATRAALSEVEGFRWCLNRHCDAGQIYPRGCDKARCYACRRSSCARHDVPWHSGETCEAYERRTRSQRKSYKLSEKHIKKITKPCPGCKKKVNKYSGCDHITCVCGHEWCWLCSATYTRDSQSFLRCKHEPECIHSRVPPIWERHGDPFPFPMGPPPHLMGPPPHPMRPRPPPFGDRPEQPGRNRPEPPELDELGFPADIFDLLFEPGDAGIGPRHPRRHGIPFLDEATLFDLDQFMERAR
ncbi:hypothetical protein F4802DRAFT_610851 [Xylaria palmicola]|nr:hypothetical protein F4802DRAFT_610851 [Xylaria palmicola]